MKRAGVVAVALYIVGALACPAFAAWSARGHSGSGAGVRAMTLAPGPTPTAAVAGTSVTVSWPAFTQPSADGYLVASFDSIAGTSRVVGAGCAGIVTTTSCTELGVPDGTWYYTVTPVLSAWRGPSSTPSNDVTVEARDPAPTAVQLANGPHGSDGVADPHDQVAITFSEPLAVTSLCDDWTGDDVDHALTGSDVVVHLDDVAGHTRLTVTATGPGRCALHVGTVDLGADYLVSANATFTDSKVEWKVATRRLVVTLGALATGQLTTTPVDPATATYTPDAAVTDRFGRAVVTTPVTTGSQRL